MSEDWNTKYGTRRVRRDPPTLDEAIFAAAGITEDQEAQAEIAAALMGLPIESVTPEVKKLARSSARSSPLSASRRSNCTPGRIGIDGFSALRDGRMCVRYLGTEIAFARQTVHDCALLICQLLLRKSLDAGGCRIAIPLDVTLDVGRISEVMIVLVQAIRDASESTQALEGANEIRLNGVPRAVHFLLVRPLGAEACELYVDSLLDFRRGVTRPSGRIKLEDGSEKLGLQIDRDVLSDLLLVNQ